jgi:hypothetical protein
MNGPSYSRTIRICFNKNTLCFNSIVSVLVLSSLTCHQWINAIDETANDGDNPPMNGFLEKTRPGNDSLTTDFPDSNTTNLTNNNEDSIYAQVGASGDNVYVVWQESVTKSLPRHNYDIFFIKSEDEGKSFGMPINLSNNAEYSERPQIAVSKNGLFVVWAETADSDNKEIMFTKSLDNGTTFSKAINLSNTPKNSNHPEISTYNENVYVIWRDTAQNNTNGNVMFTRSPDSGDTFNKPIELANNANTSFPKVSSYGNYVYTVWNNENEKNGGLFFARSYDEGNSFEEVTKLDDLNSGEPQISSSENKVLVVWGGLHSKNIGNIYFAESNNNGSTFENSKAISDKIAGKPNNTKDYNQFSEIIRNPLNVEVDSHNLSYIVWQGTDPQENQEIFLLFANQTNNDDTKILNLSNNAGVSECPSVSISSNNVYVTWEDFTSGNHEVLFSRFIDR